MPVIFQDPSPPRSAGHHAGPSAVSYPRYPAPHADNPMLDLEENDELSHLPAARPRSQYLDIDEDHRLRIVRTPTESLHELAREDERRRVGKRKRRATFRGRSFFGGNSKLGRTASQITSHSASQSQNQSVSGHGHLSSSAGNSQHGHTSAGPGGLPRSTSGSGIAAALAKASHGFAASTFGQQVDEARQQQHNTRTANQEEEAKAEQFRAPAEEGLHTSAKSGEQAAEARRRRNVYLNVEVDPIDLDKYGEPRIYSRNKVRTSKYTLWTFLPKNLTEQFRRVANLYFLGLVILQIFPIFGGASPVLAMLPLLAILMITGIKDGIEDYRRQQLDEAVNNSAVTRLGDWRNVNVPGTTRGLFARIFGLKGTANPDYNQQKVSKGVRKLRQREGELSTDFLYTAGGRSSSAHLDTDIDANQSTTSLVLQHPGMDMSRQSSSQTMTPSVYGNNANLLVTLAEDESSQYADITLGNESTATLKAPPMIADDSKRTRSGSIARSVTTSRSVHKTGVVDYDRQAPGTAKWERTLWKKLEVGDVVLLRDNDQVPADMVVLATSDADGQCFVETKNLDGETNLKPRRALKGTMSIQHEEDIEHAAFVIDSEPPHANLYSYNGVLRFTTQEAGSHGEKPLVDKQEAITINELLLRGCAIRNTTWIIALVVYTGEDTKIMLNQGETPSKRSKIEKETNFNVIANFVILVGLCLAAALANGLYINQANTSASSFEQGVQVSSNNVLNAVITFGACLIVFQNIVPISLVITVELVKTIQAIFIYQDVEMYYEPLDHPCVPKTWNISDDLGQIEYIFSDKTGTLTQNIMEFKKCSINGVAYGEGVTEAMLGAAKREGKDISSFDPVKNEAMLTDLKNDMMQRMQRLFDHKYLREDKLTFIAPKAIEDLADTSRMQRTHITQFFRALAICHTVLADHPEADNLNVIEYKAESPDEAALVAAARDCGFVFLHKSNNQIEIEVLGQKEYFQPLRLLEFNSSRKRMSVLVRQADGRILMICKGADSAIYQRLDKQHDLALKDATTRDMEIFANAGLRTLCISYRYIPEEEFVAWAAAYDAACAATTDREDEIERACEIIEKDLTIVGATALEDKLQVGVPDAIAQLHRAGIKLWILTGDKVQTAIEIGFSCNLLTSDMDIMILSSETEEGGRTQIESGLNKILEANSNPVARPSSGFAVVIDGETLRFALSPMLKPLFLDLTTQCSAVVCCRVSPSQKALTVKLVKDGRKAMTLAIGDGANDVAMIQEAHIGVGIAGLEGAQASMSADYAVGQFRFLTKLLLVHGRWCYVRVAEMHANFFYKNIVWVFAMFWYQFYCSFDAGYLFDYSLILLYNVAFTSLPVVIMGAFDQDLNAKYSMAYPQLYKRGILGLEYNRLIFWAYMVDGLYQSAVVFFIPYLVYAYGLSLVGAGYDISAQVELGTTVASSAVLCVTLFVGLNTHLWTAIVAAVLAISGLLLYVWIAIYSAFPLQFNYLVVILFSCLDYWLLILIVQIVALAPRYTFKYIRSSYFPLDIDIVREMTILGGLHSQSGDAEIGNKEKKVVFKDDGLPSQVENPRMSDSPIGSPSVRASLPASSRSTVDLEMSELAYNNRLSPKKGSASKGLHSQQHFEIPDIEELGRADVATVTSLVSDTCSSHLDRRESHLSHDQRHSTGYQSISGRSAARSDAPTSSRSTPFASPQATPNAYRQSHQSSTSHNTQPGLTRNTSVVSFSTAVDEPYSDSGDEYIHAR